MKNYPSAVAELYSKIEEKNRDQVEKISKLLFDTVEAGGVLFVFGSGHSAILVEEAFHRAGGLIPVYPVLHTFLTPHTPPKISGKLERLTGVASILFDRLKAKKGDLFFIASNSGINAAAIEMAELSQKAGITTVAFTSLEHSTKTPSRHASKKRLFENCDIVLDNCAPQGDGLLDFSGVRVGACSSLANIFLYNWILGETCGKFVAAGKNLPIYKSANLPGGDEHNEALEKKYIDRIPSLR